MRTAARPLPQTFEGLNRLHPLRAIHSERQYEAAHAIARRLMLLPDRTQGQLDYLETLSVLMEAYEREHHVAGELPASPLAVLKLLVAEHDMTASDLGRVLGNRQLGAAILRGERELSKTHIARLAAHFRVSPALFIDMSGVDAVAATTG